MEGHTLIGGSNTDLGLRSTALPRRSPTKKIDTLRENLDTLSEPDPSSDDGARGPCPASSSHALSFTLEGRTLTGGPHADGSRSTALPRIGPAGEIEDFETDCESDTSTEGGVRVSLASEDDQNESRIGWMLNGKLLNTRQWRSLEVEMTMLRPVDDQYAVIGIGNFGRLQGIYLRSQYLQTLYQKVADYIPGVSYDNEEIAFGHPFQPLYFYLDDMCTLAQKGKSTKSKNNPAKPEDVHALIKFYDQWIKPSHDRIRARISDGSVRFEDLWAVFRPGEILYSKDEFHKPQLFRIGASAYREGMSDFGDDYDSDDERIISQLGIYSRLLNLDAPKRFCFDCWNIKWEGSTRAFTRALSTFHINNFRGTRTITSLPFYPLKYFLKDESSREEFLANLEKRGHLWKGLVSGDPRSYRYDGPAMELEKGMYAFHRSDPVNLNERVVVDHDGADRFEDPEKSRNITLPPMKDLMDSIHPILDIFSRKERSVKTGDFDERFLDLDNVSAEINFVPLQAQLCPSSVNCFSLTSRKWFAVSVENLHPIEWDKVAWDHLVLEDGVKDTIKALVEQHRARSNDHILGDVISGKGNGLVIVLHGPPGVGKTLTAESVAEITERPLYSINVGEVTSEEHARSRLFQIFTEATRWNAVLLLDEADVVLEKRSFEDIRRNGTVSIFLRMLEYYEGILFLTTNRLLHIDDAFQSRIHLAYEYKPLNQKVRSQIWKNFISRMPDSESVSKEDLLDHLDKLQEEPLNGRQIRNVIFLAQSLALRRNGGTGGLRYKDVQHVIGQTLGFQQFFHRGGELSRGLLSEIGRSPPWNQ